MQEIVEKRRKEDEASGAYQPWNDTLDYNDPSVLTMLEGWFPGAFFIDEAAD